MIRKPGICFLLLLFYLQATAIEAVVSHSVFYLPGSGPATQLLPTIDVCWQINPRTLHYTTTPEKKIIARIKTDVVFMNESGVIKEDHFILETVPRSSVEELGKHSIIDLRHYSVIPGNIKMRVTLTDVKDSLHHFVFNDSFLIAPTPSKPFYSDLQLLDTTLPSAAQTVFIKNGQQQVPACTNFIDDSKVKLHYYTELYKTNTIPKEDQPLIQRVTITKKEDDPPAKSYLNADTIKPQDKITVSGTLNIQYLQSGNYYLCARVEDKHHNIVASQSFFFQRLNTRPIPEDTILKNDPMADTGVEHVNYLNLNKTFVAKYTLAEIRAILKMLLPVSDATGTSAINGFLKKPDEMYMRYYVYNYFVSINKKDPAQAWKEYTVKVKEVNKLFTAHATAGYETDRGFIYLRYGTPTETVTVENEPGALPYEIWQYNNLTDMNRKELANAVFLFYRQNQMSSDYRLLHSTVTGEVQNPDWRSFLYNGVQGGNNMNSRAEQYIGNR